MNYINIMLLIFYIYIAFKYYKKLKDNEIDYSSIYLKLDDTNIQINNLSLRIIDLQNEINELKEKNKNYNCLHK